jgi:hypothetical protein
MDPIPSFGIYHKLDDETTLPGLKTWYINMNAVDELEDYRFVLPRPINSFYDQECRIFINPRLRGGYVNAYPNHITMEELHILFPKCNFIRSEYPIDPCELFVFRDLQELGLESIDQENINGIEFLSSLERLSLGPIFRVTDVRPCLIKDLSHLNSLPLKSLVIESDSIEDLGYLNIETLEFLWLRIDTLTSLKGLNVPNLKTLVINIFQYGLLLSLDIPAGCQIYLTNNAHLTDDENKVKIINMILKIINSVFPDVTVEIRY